MSIPASINDFLKSNDGETVLLSIAGVAAAFIGFAAVIVVSSFFLGREVVAKRRQLWHLRLGMYAPLVFGLAMLGLFEGLRSIS